MNPLIKRLGVVFLILLVGYGAYAIMKSNKEKNAKTAMSADNYAIFPVTVAQVTRQQIEDKLTYIGTTFPNREVTITSETQGRIKELYFDIGKSVSEGSPLIKVDDELKQAAFITATANFEKAEKDFKRYEQLSKGKSVSDIQYETAKLAYKTSEAALITARRQLSDTKITSPISGVITTKPVEVGTVLATGTVITNIVDVSTLKIRLNVAESDVFKISAGDGVEITSDSYSDHIYRGKVKSVNAKADESHTFQVEITMPNDKNNPLRAGMFVRTKFAGVVKGEATVIPREALIGSARQPQVYVLENNFARLRDIQINQEVGSLIEVISGLSVGETVIISGQMNLRDSSSVKVIESSTRQISNK
jgi:RND family efflux transporter MFP subunit